MSSFDHYHLAVMGSNAVAIGTIFGAANHYLPGIATVLAIAWYSIVFYDRFFGRDRTIKKEATDDIQC